MSAFRGKEEKRIAARMEAMEKYSGASPERALDVRRHHIKVVF